MSENMDDLIAQIEADERADSLEALEFMSIGDFARAHGIRPQLVHYYLKTGKMHRVQCACGRPVLSVKEANQVLEDAERKRNEKGIGVEDKDE